MKMNEIFSLISVAISVATAIFAFIKIKNISDHQQIHGRMNHQNFESIGHDIYELREIMSNMHKNLDELDAKNETLFDRYNTNAKDFDKYIENTKEVFYNYSNEVMYTKNDILMLGERLRRIEESIMKDNENTQE